MTIAGAAVEAVVAVYGLTYAAGLITAGRLGDRFGRRRLARRCALPCAALITGTGFGLLALAAPVSRG